METVTVDKYNEMQTQKWHKDYDARLIEISQGKRHITELPQLAFYLMRSDIHYGYVAYGNKRAVWGKSKADAINKFKIN
jgi:hypothetical protein